MRISASIWIILKACLDFGQVLLFEFGNVSSFFSSKSGLDALMWFFLFLTSAYIGGLWLAVLYATKDMLSYAASKEQNPAVKKAYTEKEQKFSEILAKSKVNYHEKLWIGNNPMGLCITVQARTSLRLYFIACMHYS